jgi:hypothetical protein
LTAEEPGFKVCYRHPRKVAVQNCELCGRPICTQCGQESGDPKFCLPCKQDTMLHGERLLKEAQEEKLGLRPQARQTPAEIGEVTVLDDGTVVRPPAPPTITYEPEVSEGGPDVPPLVLAQQDADGLLQAETAEEEPAPGEMEVPTDEVEVPADELKAVPEKAKAEKSVMGRGPRTEVWSQMLYALRYAVGVGALVTGAWLLIAFGAKQWTQISVFTMGVAVPWALFNGTTRRKYLGVRVWRETPPAIYMSTVSFLVVMGFTLLMEYLARLIIFGSRFPVSDFAQRYFKTADWVLVICGLALSALTPVVLKVSADLSAPSLRRKTAKKSEQGEAEEIEQKLKEELGEEPAARLEPGAGEETGTGEEPTETYWD